MADQKLMTVADVRAMLNAWPPTERFTVTDTYAGFEYRVNAYGRNQNPQYFTPHHLEFDRERNLPFLRFDAVTLTNEGLGAIHFYMEVDPTDKRVLHVEARPPIGAPPSFELVEHFEQVCRDIQQEYAQPGTEDERPRLDQQIWTTATHYGVTKKKVKQDVAAHLMGTSGRTYRRYRDNKWLLSEQKFKEETGETIEQYWNDHA